MGVVVVPEVELEEAVGGADALVSSTCYDDGVSGGGRGCGCFCRRIRLLQQLGTIQLPVMHTTVTRFFFRLVNGPGYITSCTCIVKMIMCLFHQFLKVHVVR